MSRYRRHGGKTRWPLIVRAKRDVMVRGQSGQDDTLGIRDHCVSSDAQANFVDCSEQFASSANLLHRCRLASAHKIFPGFTLMLRISGEPGHSLPFTSTKSGSHIASLSDGLFRPQPPRFYEHETPDRCFHDKQQNADRQQAPDGGHFIGVAGQQHGQSWSDQEVVDRDAP